MTYNPKIKNTSDKDMSIDANVDANNITMGEAEDNDWTDGIFAFSTETKVGTAIDKINELLKGLAPKVPSDLDNLSVEGTSTTLGQGVSVKIVDATNSFPISAQFSNFQTDSFATVGDSHSKLVFARQGGTNLTRLGAFSAHHQVIIATEFPEIGSAIPNGDKEGDSNDTYVNLRENAFRVVRGKSSTFRLYVNSDQASYQGTIDNMSDDDAILELTPVLPNRYLNATCSLGKIEDGKFLNSGETFDLFQSRTAILSFPGEGLVVNGHNYIRLSHQIEGEDEKFTNYVDFFRDNGSKEAMQKTFTLNPEMPYTGITYGLPSNPLDKSLSGIKYHTGGRYLCQGSITNFGSDVYSAKSNGGIRRSVDYAGSGLSVDSHFDDTSFDPSTNIYNFSYDNGNAIEISHEPNSRLFHSTPTVKIVLENVYDNSNEEKGITLTVDATTDPASPFRLMFDNFGNTSGPLIENFDDEAYREKVDANGNVSQNVAGTSDWNSADDLAAQDMVVAMGRIQAQAILVNSLIFIQASSPAQSANMTFTDNPTQDAYYIRKVSRPSGGISAGKLVVDLGINISSAESGNDVVIEDNNNVALDISILNNDGEWKSVLLDSGCRAPNEARETTQDKQANETVELGFNLLTGAIPAAVNGIGGSTYIRIKTNQSFIGTIKKIELVHA